MPFPSPPQALSRRRFLRQSFAFSALASLGSFSGLASPVPSDPAAAQLFVVGDWGYDNPTAQAEVAAGLSGYAEQHSLRPQALFMLGDNWYGELAGGAGSAAGKPPSKRCTPPATSLARRMPSWETRLSALAGEQSGCRTGVRAQRTQRWRPYPLDNARALVSLYLSRQKPTDYFPGA